MVLTSLTRGCTSAAAAVVARPHHATRLSSLAAASRPAAAAVSLSAALPGALLAAASRAMSRGALLPDSLVYALLDARLDLDDARHGWVLDGYPRTPSQAVSLTSSPSSPSSSEATRRPDLAIVLETSDASAAARMLSRRVDARTGHIYNLLVERPRGTASTSVVPRADDNPTAIAARLQHYRSVAPSVEEALVQGGVRLARVDASARPDVVARAIADVLDATPDASRFLILGPPGSGKGTQAVHIAQSASVPHISTGDLLREACNASTTIAPTDIDTDEGNSYHAVSAWPFFSI